MRGTDLPGNIARRVEDDDACRFESVLPTARNRFVASNDFGRASLGQMLIVNSKTGMACVNEAYLDRCSISHLTACPRVTESLFFPMPFEYLRTKNIQSSWEYLQTTQPQVL